MARNLCTQHHIPWKSRKFRHVNDQSHITVGERANDVMLFQPLQPSHRIRPWIESMPRPIQMLNFFFRQLIDAKRLQHFQ